MDASPRGTGSPALLRRFNSAAVLRTIRAHGPVSRGDVARLCGLSKPTVREIVESFIAEGVVHQIEPVNGAVPKRPGPRPRLLAFRGDFGYVVGVDIGADKILALVGDLNGELVASERRTTRNISPFNAESLLAEVLSATDAALAAAGVGKRLVKAVGVGTPGVVDPETGRVTLAPQLPGWEGIEPGRWFRQAFDCPIHVDKELHLAVVGEQWRGAARGIDDAVYIQLGVGIGAGILIGGDVYRGMNGGAGEIGYLPIDGEAHDAERGFGRLEWLAGGTAFARLGRQAAEGPDGALLLDLAGGEPEAIDAKIVFEAARRGSQAADHVVQTIVKRIARAIASVACVLNPSTVLIGGGISGAGDALLRPLEQEVARLIPYRPRLVLSVLGDQAVAWGALRLATNAVENELFRAPLEAFAGPAARPRRATS